MCSGIWRKAETIKSPELRDLASTLPTIIYSGLAEKTSDKYLSGWNKWLHWCSVNQEVVPRPAEPFFVALYLNHVLFTKGTVGSLITAFYGIRWGHHVVGLNSPTNNPLVKLAFEGCQHLCPRESCKKEPISCETIKELVDIFNRNDKRNLLEFRTLIVCLLGFSGFFRIQELLSVKLKEIEINNEFLKIIAPKSKTDQHRDGNEVFISRLNSQYCPVAYVEKFLIQSGLDPKRDEESFLIPRLIKTKDGHRVMYNKGISYTSVRDTFKETLKSVVKSVNNYGLHSLRSGGASAAAANDVTDRMISKQGRWKSEQGRNGYIKDTIGNRLKVSKSLGI